MHEELKRFQELLRREILSSLPSDDCELVQAMRYALDKPGKMLRPLLAFSISHAPGVENREICVIGNSIECLHTFTLIHDDIMDNSPLRRGLPAVHRRWGINLAILAGDALLAHALKLLLQIENSAAYLKLVASILPEVSFGQALDLEPIADSDRALSEYRQMAAGKTGALFGLATAMGAVVAGYDLDQQRIAQQLGIELGMAYQMRDDYLDFFPAEPCLEIKGMDLRLRKRSILLLLGLKRIPGLFAEIVSQKAKDTTALFQRVTEALVVSGARDELRSRIESSKENCLVLAKNLPKPAPLLAYLIAETLSLPHNP